MADMRYDAFISYSHKDMKWGRWIQKKLERYRLPRQLREEAGEKRSSLHIFRDQTDLAGVELQATLQRELESSRYMIVICSPASAASKWVNEEVRYFKSLGRTDYIIPFIVDGEPESDDPGKECYPEELRNEGGNRHFLGVNIREIGRNKAFLKTASILMDVRFDRVVDREKRNRNRTILIASAVSLLAAAVVGGLLWHNAVMERENERLTREKEEADKELELVNTYFSELKETYYWFSLVTGAYQETVAPDIVEMVRKAADMGNADAMYYMGFMAYNGLINGTPDRELAFQWYLKGAEAGDTNSMAAVGARYANGDGVDKDENNGFVWLMKAADAGHMESMAAVADCYMGGYGVEENEVTAVHWYEKAANAGSPYGMRQLGIAYLTGTGKEQNAEKGVQWIRSCAEQGDSMGMYMIGQLYSRGIAVGNDVVLEKDDMKAFQWFRKAAEAGDKEGMYWTAWCLENRVGIDAEAEDWYRQAAALGQPDAIEALERIRASENTDQTTEETVPVTQ